MSTITKLKVIEIVHLKSGHYCHTKLNNTSVSTVSPV